MNTTDIILNELERITGTDQVRRDLDLALYDEEILDSLGTVELMVALGEDFKIGISPAQINREQWSSPRKIIAYIEQRVNA
jgi:D-alanine--poly(phosphoribitol) ligase subunit 2